MIDTFKKMNQSSMLTLILLGCIVIAWFGCNHLAKRFSMLPVMELPKAVAMKKVIDIRTLYPVLVEITRKAESTVSADAPLDAAFVEPEPVVLKVAPLPVDYVSEVRKHIELEGLSAEGAFINGHYYLVGEVISSVVSDGVVRVNPILTSVDRTSITVSVMKRKFTMRLLDI